MNTIFIDVQSLDGFFYHLGVPDIEGFHYSYFSPLKVKNKPHDGITKLAFIHELVCEQLVFMLVL
jgi:hypothetical protein